MSEFSTAPEAVAAHSLVRRLQERLVDTLQRCAAEAGHPVVLEPVSWLRDEGRHGGGTRFQSSDSEAFDRASVNVSHVHYDDLPEKRLGSATALSSIVHPRHPAAPSVHLHTSYTATRDGRGYWRVMADLNPSHPHDGDRATFVDALRAASGVYYEGASEQGDKYFRIPALDRHRGVSHFYLEAHDSGDYERDRALAECVETAAIDAYGAILRRAWGESSAPTPQAEAAQLAYHTVYFFQVLTMDRGTTSGLLVHGDNDVGILGSLPSHVNPTLLRSWVERVPGPQRPLVTALASVFPAGATRCPVTVEAKRALANTVRDYYATNPEALAFQASGYVVPPTVSNHR